MQETDRAVQNGKTGFVVSFIPSLTQQILGDIRAFWDDGWLFFFLILFPQLLNLDAAFLFKKKKKQNKQKTEADYL